MTPALVAYGGEQAVRDHQSRPPYKRKSLFEAVEGRPQLNLSPVASGSYDVTITFLPTLMGKNSSVIADSIMVPVPVAGAIPVSLVKSAGWVGRVQWRELDPNGLMGRAVSGAFEAGVAYGAQIRWAPESTPDNVVQMPRGAYRAGNAAQAQESLAPSKQEPIRRSPPWESAFL
jgi:hypothetical protein